MLKLPVLIIALSLGLSGLAWPDLPTAAGPPEAAPSPPSPTRPDLEAPWTEYDLAEAGKIKIPGQPDLIVHNQPYRPWPDFFKGHFCEMGLLLQANYQTEADQIGLIAAVVRIAPGRAPSAGGDDKEPQITSSLENSMAAFEESFIGALVQEADEFELVGKEIMTNGPRPTFKASYRYLKAGQPNLIQAAVFLHEGRLYLMMLDADEQDQTFWGGAFERILAEWRLD